MFIDQFILIAKIMVANFKTNLVTNYNFLFIIVTIIVTSNF